MTRSIAVGIAMMLIAPLTAADPKASVADRVLFDFEEASEAAAWSPLAIGKEPAPKIERVAEQATAGKHSLKITFAGGTWPTVQTTAIPADWDGWQTFRADVTVTRPCVVGFTVMQENSKRGTGWDGAVSRWSKTEIILKPGTHTLTAALHPNEWSAVRTKLENGKVLGNCVSLEFFVYEPHDGDVVFIDNIRLVGAKEQQPAVKTVFRVLGTDMTVTGVQELGKKLASQWKKPEPQTSAQAETAFRARFAEMKKTHPKAVLAILRDGEAGFDPTNPE
ncbi:MAG TPA: hypothetical protein VHR66_30720, partial [Gemmataceae bacterium]|nr:hypothetical protein [Gemmataceae bacterium]